MKFITLTLILLIGLFASAQQTTDIIHLKNGSIIKGKIVEKTDEKIKIETFGGNIFVYSSQEIDKTETTNEPLPGYLKAKGYYNYTSMGILVGSDIDENQSVFSVLMEHNYQLYQYFAIGGVIGIDFFNESIAPLGVNLKALLPLKAKSTIFINTSSGYSIPLEDAENDNNNEYTDTKGGVFINSEIGIIVPSKSNINLFLALGYRYNELNYIRSDWQYGNVERKVTYNRFVLRIGICLH